MNTSTKQNATTEPSATHTPGKLIVGSSYGVGGGSRACPLSISGSPKLLIAEAYTSVEGLEPYHANATRLALCWNAHDILLAACERVHRAIAWSSTHERMTDLDIATLLDTAIARATHQPQPLTKEDKR